jgi:hypothetical protein
VDVVDTYVPSAIASRAVKPILVCALEMGSVS